MPLPHSVFGGQVYTSDRRHWWQRHKLPKPKRPHLLRRNTDGGNAARSRTTGTTPAPASTPITPVSPIAEAARDAFTRAAPAANNPAVRRPSDEAFVSALMASGARDPEGEVRAMQHFASAGYDGAVAALSGAHPRIITHVADAACVAGAYDAARALYHLAFEREPEAGRVAKHLTKRAQNAGRDMNADAQRLYLWAWMDTQPLTFQSLAQGCKLACTVNPALARSWYLQAELLAEQARNTEALERLTRALLEAQAYAMVIEHTPADRDLLGVLKTRDPQLLSWVATAARSVGALEVANQLDRRAQEASSL